MAEISNPDSKWRGFAMAEISNPDPKKNGEVSRQKAHDNYNVRLISINDSVTNTGNEINCHVTK